MRMAAFEHVRRLGEVHVNLTAAELRPGLARRGRPVLYRADELPDPARLARRVGELLVVSSRGCRRLFRTRRSRLIR
jgi:hypothetical protein